ncbi:MAG: TlpA family protein disulfide reductase [Gemmatimonadota bacterium]|nr:TlpA family protein disulfide reductase [Gemmatimonadota bacterium]
MSGSDQSSAGRYAPRVAYRVDLCIAAACLGAAIACAEGREDRRFGAPAPVEVGRPAPAYRAVSASGDSVSLQALRGKPVLLNVWATWCHPCRDEIPELQQLHERYAERGLALVGVSVDATGDEAAIAAFARRYGMTYSVWRDPDERVSATFLVIGVPATFLIDRGGVLRWKKTGPIRPGDTILTAAIDQALASGR